MTPTIVVSVPYFGTPKRLLKRAVESALFSSVKPVVVVVADGGPLHNLSILNHPRCVTFVLPQNLGRYFSDNLVIDSLPSECFWAPLDSDDYVSPLHYSHLSESLIDGAAVSPTLWGTRRLRRTIVKPVDRQLLDDTDSLEPGAAWVSGLYSSTRLKLAGGLHPEARVGYDVLFLKLLRMSGRIGIASTAGYHVIRRGNSLTTARASRHGSEIRQRDQLLRERVFQRVQASRPTAPREAVKSLVSSAVLECSEYFALQLRPRIRAAARLA